MSRNKILTFPDDLEYLSISRCDLEYISPIAFEGMSPEYSGHTIHLVFQDDGALERLSKETFDPFLYAPGNYSLLDIQLDNSGLDCQCEMVWIPHLLTQQKNMGLSPDRVSDCYSTVSLFTLNVE